MPFSPGDDILCEIDEELELVENTEMLWDVLMRARTPGGAYRFIISPFNLEDEYLADERQSGDSKLLLLDMIGSSKSISTMLDRVFSTIACSRLLQLSSQLVCSNQ